MQAESAAARVVVYFQRKTTEWSKSGKTVPDYIKSRGVVSLSDEFKRDPNFAVVCEFISQVGTLQLRSQLLKGFEELTGALFGLPLVGAMDIVIAAIEEACGQKVPGELLLKGVSAVVAGLAVVGIAAGLAALVRK